VGRRRLQKALQGTSRIGGEGLGPELPNPFHGRDTNAGVERDGQQRARKNGDHGSPVPVCSSLGGLSHGQLLRSRDRTAGGGTLAAYSRGRCYYVYARARSQVIPGIGDLPVRLSILVRGTASRVSSTSAPAGGGLLW